MSASVSVSPMDRTGFNAMPLFAARFQPVAAVDPPKPPTPDVLVAQTVPVPDTNAMFCAVAVTMCIEQI